MARAPRTAAVEEEQATSVAEVEALADRLPVTGGGSEVPVDLQISIRDQARDLLERGAASPEAADRLSKPLPDYWRTQWRRRFVPSPLPDVRRIRAVDPYG